MLIRGELCYPLWDMSAEIPPLLRPQKDLLPDFWTYAYVERKAGRGVIESRWEIVHLDGESNRSSCYVCEPLHKIRMRCLGLAASLPLYTCAYVIAHTVRAPFVVIAYQARICKALVSGSASCSWTVLLSFSLKMLAQAIKVVIKAPLYMLAMMYVALLGVIDPLKTRASASRIEGHWKKETDPFGEASLFFPEEGLLSAGCRFLTGRSAGHVGLIPVSFYPYASLSDEDVVSVRFPRD